MDVKLDSLIAKIKKDGIEEAKKASREITGQAQKQASEIIASARKQAEAIVSQAKKETEKLKINGESSLKQAARDLLLTLKNEISSLLASLIKQRVSRELEPEFLQKLIIKIVEAWAVKKDAVLEVLVSKQDKAKLESLLHNELKAKAKEKVELKINPAIDKGFRIGLKGEDLHYDFTEETLSETFKQFLNPAIAAMLDTK